VDGPGVVGRDLGVTADQQPQELTGRDVTIFARAREAHLGALIPPVTGLE
jgi:hypothetical protein